jgi:DNA-binding transcriptional LysR family regulator
VRTGPRALHHSDVELDWLRTFLAVLDRGGFAAAAEQVHRSQSRVSAHIAALERELGATLIDRARRPARATRAGEVLAAHARDILGAVGSAQSAVSAARDLDGGRLALLSTPCLVAAFLPGPLARVAAACPGVRFAVLEDGRHDVERRFLDDGVLLAVLPEFVAPAAPGLRERFLWQEPLRAIVPSWHPLAHWDAALPVDEVVREPLVLTGASGDAPPEAVDLLARRGVAAAAAATADCPASVAALVRAGLGVGLLMDVAARGVLGDDLVAVPLADDGLVRRVAVYWYDVLLGTDVGRVLHREVLATPPPPGAVPVDGGGEPLLVRRADQVKTVVKASFSSRAW